MKDKIYYRITDNRCDSWEIVATTKREGNVYETFSEAKQELIEIFKAAIDAEQNAIYEVEELKKSDVKYE